MYKSAFISHFLTFILSFHLCSTQILKPHSDDNISTEGSLVAEQTERMCALCEQSVPIAELSQILPGKNDLRSHEQCYNKIINGLTYLNAILSSKHFKGLQKTTLQRKTLCLVRKKCDIPLITYQEKWGHESLRNLITIIGINTMETYEQKRKNKRKKLYQNKNNHLLRTKVRKQIEKILNTRLEGENSIKNKLRSQIMKTLHASCRPSLSDYIERCGQHSFHNLCNSITLDYLHRTHKTANIE